MASATDDQSKPYDSPPPYSPPAAGVQYQQPPQPYPPPAAQQQYAQYPAPAPSTVYYADNAARGGQVIVTQTTQPQTTLVVRPTGDCPNCRIGMMIEQISCCGLLWAIFFFPIGIICCLMMKQRVCPKCGYVVL